MGTSVQLDDSTLGSFNERVPGAVLHPAEDGYDEGRSVRSAEISKDPAIIIHCRLTADSLTMVKFVRDHGSALAVKGGWHHSAGHGVRDDAFVIDLTPINGVRVDSDVMTVQVQGEAVRGDLNYQLHAFDLEVVGMPYDEVGVGGVTLGGGMGTLSRKYGSAIDDLRSVDVVTSDDELIQASGDEHPALLRGLQGRSGNVGIVTSCEFGCLEEHPEALQGMVLHLIEDAMDGIRSYREVIADAPEEVIAGTGIVQMPANPHHQFEPRGPGRPTDA